MIYGYILRFWKFCVNMNYKFEFRFDGAKQRVANEKKQNEKKRKAKNHHKYIIGGIVMKYFLDGYRYDEGEI